MPTDTAANRGEDVSPGAVEELVEAGAQADIERAGAAELRGAALDLGVGTLEGGEPGGRAGGAG